jgi:hypothetical protein
MFLCHVAINDLEG